jgi:RHH-type transcriptional regulator, rel operon repressor / antitoxin RelB
MEKVNVTLRLDKDKIALLDQLAQSDDRDRTYLIKNAIDGYLNMRQWQLDEIKKAITEADSGDFVPEEEMQALFAKWSQ